MLPSLGKFCKIGCCLHWLLPYLVELVELFGVPADLALMLPTVLTALITRHAKILRIIGIACDLVLSCMGTLAEHSALCAPLHQDRGRQQDVGCAIS